MSHKRAKKLRKEVRKLKFDLSADLKGAINNLRLKDRIRLAIRIILKKDW